MSGRGEGNVRRINTTNRIQPGYRFESRTELNMLCRMEQSQPAFPQWLAITQSGTDQAVMR